MPPEDKDAALFPRRFDGRWAMIHRPSPLRGGAHMWLSYSPDLRHWGDHKLLLEARDGAWWDAGKIGLGPPPLETRRGLARHVPRRPRHRRRSDLPGRPGAARPRGPAAWSCIARTSGSSGPSAPYEMTGDVGRVVFPCGWVHDEAADRLLLYYGAADTAIAVATATSATSWPACWSPPGRRSVFLRGGAHAASLLPTHSPCRQHPGAAPRKSWSVGLASVIAARKAREAQAAKRASIDERG